jgi:hypothetical protein
VRIEALTHLADAGIAVNFAFGILEHYKGFITTRVTESLAATADGLRAIVLDRLASNSAAVQIETARISKIPASLERRTSWCQGACLVLAVLCVIGLILLLVCAAIHGDTECKLLDPWTWTLIVLGMATGPIVICVVVMSLFYALARVQLWGLQGEYKIIGAFTKNMVIAATDPGGEIPSAPPPDTKGKTSTSTK